MLVMTVLSVSDVSYDEALETLRLLSLAFPCFTLTNTVWYTGCLYTVEDGWASSTRQPLWRSMAVQVSWTPSEYMWCTLFYTALILMHISWTRSYIYNFWLEMWYAWHNVVSSREQRCNCARTFGWWLASPHPLNDRGQPSIQQCSYYQLAQFLWQSKAKRLSPIVFYSWSLHYALYTILYTICSRSAVVCMTSPTTLR